MADVRKLPGCSYHGLGERPMSSAPVKVMWGLAQSGLEGCQNWTEIQKRSVPDGVRAAQAWKVGCPCTGVQKGRGSPGRSVCTGNMGPQSRRNTSVLTALLTSNASQKDSYYTYHKELKASTLISVHTCSQQCDSQSQKVEATHVAHRRMTG